MNRYVYIAIACSMASNLQSESLFTERYNDLTKSPIYTGMAAIAIAATLEDFQAIEHFLYGASSDDLITARAILENRLDILKNDLHKNPPRETRSPIEKIESHESIHHRIHLVKNSIKQLSDKINLLNYYADKKKSQQINAGSFIKN